MAVGNCMAKDGSFRGRLRKPKVPKKTCLAFGQYLKEIKKMKMHRLNGTALHYSLCNSTKRVVSGKEKYSISLRG